MALQMQPVGLRSGLRQAPRTARPGLALARTGGVRRLPMARRVAMPEAPASEGNDGPTAAAEEPTDALLDIDYTRPFPAEIPMEPNTKALASIPLALYYPAVLAAAAAAGLVGGAVTRATPVPEEQRDILATVVAAAAAGGVVYAGVQAKSLRDRAAVVDLFNLLVALDEPSDLTPDDVKAVGDKYGINMQKEQMTGLQQVFGQYLENIIPAGDTQLRGDEAPKLIAFKDALGLGDEDAAPVFIEVGRRLSRAGYETKERSQQFEQRKAFQRLIYVSYAVFGDQKAAFLLPWRRVFNLNDSQLFVARRDNARAIFNQHLREIYGGELPADRTALRELRDFQASVKLMDDVAEESVRSAARTHIEGQLAAAVEVVKSNSKNRDPARLVEVVRLMLEYGRKLQRSANEDDLVPGLGLPSLHGGEWDAEAKSRDVREVFRMFTEEVVAREGAFTPAIDADLKELSAMLCLGSKAAADVRSEVAAGLYRRLLREEVTSRRIDGAESPAKALSDMIEKSGFSAEAAAELHKSLYRQKVNQLVAKKKLTDQDDADLARIRRILCVPDDAAAEVERATAGRMLEEALSDVFLNGAKPVPDIEAERVEQVVKDLRVKPAVAKEVFAEVARSRLKAYALQAAKDMSRDRKAAAQALKKLVQFNALAVTPMMARVTGEPLPELVEGGGEEERRGQKEVNLKDDIEAAISAELYKTYLMYSMSGDVIELPVGLSIRKKTNLQARQAEMTRLHQLADILGMSAAEVATVHQDLSEQAFRAQAQEVLRGTGSLSPERASYLDAMRKQLSLPQDKADKIVKEVRSEVLGASAALEEAGGQKWTVDRVMQAHKDGVDIERALEEGPRRALLRRELDRRLSDGKAKFDAQLLLHDLPKVLGVDEKRVTALLRELVGSRKRMLLVQAVSQHRQKRASEMAVSLNNLISAYRAMPEKDGKSVVQWGEREELKEIFGGYCARVEDPARRAELAGLFGLTEEERGEVVGAASAALDRVRLQQDEEESFF
ncbi:MAG: hypothetical protein J3K34DRAFT_517150 [Monoraphidium minutum]|nr:MAG: hypothetical protein J3K34DRAFT_517150 [Monoraphidium minutum]